MRNTAFFAMGHWRPGCTYAYAVYSLRRFGTKSYLGNILMDFWDSSRTTTKRLCSGGRMFQAKCFAQSADVSMAWSLISSGTFGKRETEEFSTTHMKRCCRWPRELKTTLSKEEGRFDRGLDKSVFRQGAGLCLYDPSCYYPGWAAWFLVCTWKTSILTLN